VSRNFLGATRHAGSAATAVDQRKTFKFTRHKDDVNALLARDGLTTGQRGFAFRPFGLGVY
jgi:hypothetical protein